MVLVREQSNMMLCQDLVDMQNKLYRKPLKFATPKFRGPCLVFMFVGNSVGKTKQCYTQIKIGILHSFHH